VSTYRFISLEKARWSVRMLCRVLRVARSAYHAWVASPKSLHAVEDSALTVHIKVIHRRSRGTYGAPRVHAELVAEGHEVGRRRVARLMRLAGLAGTPKRRYRGTTTDSDHQDRVADNVLNRSFQAAAPNQLWVGDITYLPTSRGWVYLAVLVDLFSRKIVGWAMRADMQTELCLQALRRAIATRQPAPGLVHHTDRGSQYTSREYQQKLARIGATPSMSRKGNCWDNAVAESFFGTMEQELVLNKEGAWRDIDHAKKAVGDYIHGFYNNYRRHSTNGQISPVEYEARYRALERAA